MHTLIMRYLDQFEGGASSVDQNNALRILRYLAKHPFAEAMLSQDDTMTITSIRQRYH